MPNETNKTYDIIVFGATSFVGEILTRYLLQHHEELTKNHHAEQSEPPFKWAIAGRSQDKLNQLKQSLNADHLPTLVVDAQDESALISMCQQTRVIVSTVGPYALYGEPLIKACVSQGVDYCDLTGEPQWINKMLKAYEQEAKASGARIVHCCGFDSIPSDLGVYYTQQLSQKNYGTFSSKIKMRVKKLKGGASGGTIASLLNITREAAKNPLLRKELKNPYSICSPEQQYHVRQHNIGKAEYDEDVSAWLSPFVMAAINTRIVHRSNSLLNSAYGSEFYYDEAMMTGDGSKGKQRARNMIWGLNAFMIAAAIAPTRWVLEKFILPKPGEGPTPEEQENGYFEFIFVAETDAGEKTKTIVTGDKDPGYGSTAKMLGQAALCLAFDIDHSEKKGGFWTPSTVFENKLIERLTQYSGLTFDLIKD